MKHPMSRRRALNLINGAAFLSAAAGIAVGAAAGDSANKVAQKTAGYQAQPKAGQKCASCDHFHSPDGCALVQGPISPDGWCRLFTAKTN